MRPLFIGMSGGTASGKSTLARALAVLLSDLRVRVISGDEFFLAQTPRVVAPFTGVEYQEHNHPDSFDVARMHQTVADALALEDPEGPQVLVFEGILALWDDDLRPLYDLKVFVDCESDERLIRRIKRHSQWGQSLDEVASRFLDTVRHRHREFVEPTRWYADMVLNGSVQTPLGLEVLATWVRSRVSEEVTK